MSNDMNAVLAEFQGTVVEANQDVEMEIQALEGKYVAEITKFENYTGEGKNGPYDFFGVNLKIVETVTGNKGDGRFVSKTINNGETKFASAKESMETLLKNMAAAKIDKGNSWEELVANCKASAGNKVNVKLRPKKKNGKVVVDDKGWPDHIVTMVEKFDIANPLGGTTEGVGETPASDLPF